MWRLNFSARFFDFDDWGISDKIFSFFSKLWGPFTCDVFANSDNHKVDKFYSQFWTPGTAGVDAFYSKNKYITLECLQGKNTIFI
jgi:hypothetical protein